MYYSNRPLTHQHPHSHSEPSSLKSKYIQLSNHVEELQQCYSEKITILQQSLAEANGKVGELESYVEELQGEMDSKQSEVQEHEVQIQKLLGIIQQLQVIIKQKDTQNEEVVRENRILKEEGEELQMKLYASEFEAESLKEEIRQRSSEGDTASLSSEISECKILKDILNQEKPTKKVLSPAN